MFKTFTTATAAAALLAGAAAAQDDMVENGDMGMMMTMADGQTSITFPRIRAAQDGYIVIHAVENGAPVVPGHLAHASVVAGENTNVTVSIGEALEPGTELAAMLHAETNGNGTYDFGEGMTDVDLPVMVDGAAVTTVFTVPAVMEMDSAEEVAPDVASPEERSASDDADDPDYRDEGEEAVDPNTIDETGFGNEEDDAGSVGDDDDATN